MWANSILTQPSTKPLIQFSGKIKYLVISDIHLGHKNNTAREILANLTRYFDDFSPTGRFVDLDILFIAGDLFDETLWFNSTDVVEILLFCRKLMAWCEHFGIRLRILEGTPSHDARQPRNLVPMASTFKSLNFLYVETMCIEAFEDLGITCLYMPDEFGGSALEAQRLVQELMDRLQLPKVDIAVLHGMFRYQMPEIASERFKLDEQFFLDRVRFFISIGHVHTHSVFERIIPQGSFDRLRHGEEEPKGAVYIELHPHGNSFFFIENTTAKKFVTCHIKTADIDKAIDQIRKTANKLPDDAFLRIKAKRANSVFNVYDQLSREYLSLTFSKLTEEEEGERQQLLNGDELLNVDYTPVQLYEENIVEMIMAEVYKQSDHPPYALMMLEQQLKDIV